MNRKDIIFLISIVIWVLGTIFFFFVDKNSIFIWHIFMTLVFVILVLLRMNNNVESWYNKIPGYYYLDSIDDQMTWNSICNKAKSSYNEYTNTYDDVGEFWTPYINDLSQDEINLLKKIHEYYYGIDWHVVDPLSPNQVFYIMYTNVKNKVIDYENDI